MIWLNASVNRDLCYAFVFPVQLIHDQGKTLTNKKNNCHAGYHKSTKTRMFNIVIMFILCLLVPIPSKLFCKILIHEFSINKGFF